jgi:aryl-alcohol dehydrogenase-like predicted oxidoreductase
VSLAWLLRKSPNIILIPGTSSVAHLEENLAARSVALSEDDMATLEALSIPDRSPK